MRVDFGREEFIAVPVYRGGNFRSSHRYEGSIKVGVVVLKLTALKIPSKRGFLLSFKFFLEYSITELQGIFPK